MDSQNKDSRRDAKEALCWLSCSFRQLRVQELRQALATREGDKAIDVESLVNLNYVVRSCAGLVTVDTGSQIVRFIHQTAQDFFKTRAGEYFPDAHTWLTRTCLTYLFFDEFSQGPCDFGSINPFAPGYPRIRCPIAASRFVSTRLKRYPFMKYAAHHWGDHARGKATERALQREILAFLSTPRALASTVQVQYRHVWSGSTRWSLDSSKHTPIHVVVSFALEHILEALLKTITAEDLNIEDETKKTAFHGAGELDLAFCAGKLLAAGADIRTQDKHGCTALYKASGLGYESIVKMILEHDNVARLKRKRKEIRCAILSNQTKIVETYIRAAPRLAERANLVLMKSSELDNPDIIALAMSFGADIKVEDPRGRTSLLVAVQNGRSAAVEALVTAGASTTVLEASGKTLLQVAASSQKIFEERVEFVKKLNMALIEGEHIPRSTGVDWQEVDIPVESHQSFFKCFSLWLKDSAADSDLVAAMHEDHEHLGIIRLLLSHGADPRVKTPEGETVLHLAIGSAPRVKVLLELAPVLDINAQDDQGRSALHHAAASGNHATMEVLLANGANINMRDIGGASVLHYAVGHSACVKLAIQKGSNTKAVDSRKRTALHYFRMIERRLQEQVDLDQLNVLRHFVEAGVDLDAIDSQGKKASDYLRSSSVGPHGFEETVRWIGMHLKEEQYVLQEAKIVRTFRESRARALRDVSIPIEIMKQQIIKRETMWLDQWIVPGDQAPTDSSG